MLFRIISIGANENHMTKTIRAHSPPFSTRHALVVAGLLIGGSLTLVLLTPHYINRELARRLLGVMLGGFVVYYARVIPRVLPPLTRGNLRSEQAMRRFTAWCLALGGAGYVAAWTLAPLDWANLIAVVCLAGAVIVVAARGFYLKTRGLRT